MSTFVKTDYEILSEEYDVITNHYSVGTNKMMKLFNIISSSFFAVKWVWRVDVVYCWFAGFHGFFPILISKLLGKKSIIIVGGYDAVSIPSLEYGVFYRRNLLQWCVRKIYGWATWICPVDESLVQSTNYYADPSGKGYKTGILNHMHVDESKIVVIPTGYDERIIKMIKIYNSFDIISVGYVNDDQNFTRKGFDFIFELAKVLPHLKIVIVGFTSDYLNKLKLSTPSNITIVNFVGQEELIKLFSSSKIDLQLSLAEGLPNTLCEAMLCECIPIGSDVNGIPKAIGNTGYVLKVKNVDILKSYIEEALKMDANQGALARERIMSMFPLSKRIEGLKTIINS
jgi:glycosyltransferase involved in cell wall biosynthesis